MNTISNDSGNLKVLICDIQQHGNNVKSNCCELEMLCGLEIQFVGNKDRNYKPKPTNLIVSTK